MCHGFLSKHEQMVPLSDFIHENFGWETHLVELSGHGYDADNITKVSWNDWVDDVKESMTKFPRNVIKFTLLDFHLVVVLVRMYLL